MTMELELAVNSNVCYALYHNDMDVLLTASALNDGERREGVVFRISSQPRFFEDVACKVDAVLPNSSVDLLKQPSFRFYLDPAYISEISEAVDSRVTFTAEDADGNIIASAFQDIRVLPFDHWPGITVPEILPSYITPNAPSLATVRAKASDILGEWGKPESLEGYQSESRDRVLTIAAAVFAALERENISYVNPPAGFEKTGQRIRLPDEVLSNHEGTCIDLSALYAAALESIGLNTVVFLVNGHAFVGVWLVDYFSPDIISWDNAIFTRAIRNKDFRAVECTSFTNSLAVPFDMACEKGLKRLEDIDNFLCAIDVKKSRTTVRPLPVKKDVDGRWVVVRDEGTQYTMAPQSLGAVYTTVEDRPLTKVDKWKRELLDITSKNNMINMKQGTKVIPLLVKDVAHFEDRLADGVEYTLYPKPQEWEGSAIYSEKPFESELYIGNYESAFSEEIDRNRLRTPVTDTELEKSLRSIYRLANKEMDESGCNCLFISLGVLRWYEGKSSGVPRYAPLILLPVEIKKKQKSFAIKKLEEETVFNVTLSEKLRQEFEIEIPNMDVLPTDDSGVNVDQILQTVRHCISGRDGWDVLQGAALGVFSFSQYAMWKDLDNNIGIFKENPVVRSLVDGVPYPSEKDIGADANPYGLCLTVSADGSQIKAVRAAGEGRTFVMHGPPGTGKSQTITNMITNALYQNKTVLFVAEKRAALEVVQKRLEDVGIGNHCLELHSNKTEKHRVIDQLKRSLERCGSIDESKAQELMTTIDNLRSKLDVYVTELHTDREFGLSAYEAISRYEFHDVPGAMDLRVDYSNMLRESEMVNIEESIRNANQAFGMTYGSDTNVLGHVRTTRIIASISRDAQDLIDEARRSAAAYQSELKAIRDLDLPVDVLDRNAFDTYLSKIFSIDTTIVNDPNIESMGPELRRICDLATSIIGRLASLADVGFNARLEDLSALQADLSSLESSIAPAVNNRHISDQTPLLQMARECRMFCSALLDHGQDLATIARVWKLDVFAFDRDFGLASQYKTAESAGFFSKKKVRGAFMTQVTPHLRNPMETFENLKQTIGLVSMVGPDLLRVDGIPGRYAHDARINDELNRLRTRIIAAESAVSIAKEHGIAYSSLARQYNIAVQANDRLPSLRKAEESWTSSSKKLSDYLDLDIDVSDIGACMQFCDSLQPQIGNLFDWVNWNLYAKKLKDYGLASVIPEIQKRPDIDLLVHSAMRSIYKEFITVCRQKSEALRMFSSTTFEGFVKQFKNADQTYTMYSRNVLKYKLAKNVPTNLDDSIPGTEANILYKAINSSKIRKSIRRLLSEIPNMLPRLCPCFLMSPQSVAQYITMDYPKFDLVIFDESSQITTSKAIGALGRAKNAVIAGDSKQLPPTSFFQKKIEFSEEDDDMTDVDSFLDDCLALNMPETYLEWHYRSRHESLIAFSNRMFYDSKMMTFPSPNDLETKVGLRYVKGVYEKGKRYNTIEAQAVVEEVYRRVMDDRCSGQSIGIVAFSISQQTRIQDMLDDMTKRDSEFFERLNAMPEEMFVKNLETVQGDERDVIIFSIGYGPDANGNVTQNFGPINREGGQRRLNVAVSRARMEMLVFSSMNYNDVKITSTSSRGVRSMREFLRFAENHGRFPDSSMDVSGSEGTQILVDIADTLKENGYDSHFNVGTSMFKVDIGVVDPDRPSDYILGILSDGESYRSSENTRDREYAREDVLKRLGWNLMHVWSVDWYFNKEKTLKGILAELERIKADMPAEEEEVPEVDANYGVSEESAEETVFAGDTGASVSRAIDYNPFVPPVYDIDPDTAVRANDSIRIIAGRIIEAESPINQDYLLKLYCKSVNIKRLTEQKRSVLVPKLQLLFRPQIDRDFVTYWAMGSDRLYDSYRVSSDTEKNRSIDCIPYIEIANAVTDSIRTNGSLQRDVATLVVAKSLGFNRTGSKINEIINKVIDNELRLRRIQENNGRLVL